MVLSTREPESKANPPTKIDLENNKHCPCWDWTANISGGHHGLQGQNIPAYLDFPESVRVRLGLFHAVNDIRLLHGARLGADHDGDKLIMSDGSHNLYHLDPNLFSVVKTVEVFDNKGPVTNLNELEYINGYIWANEWLTDRIVIIDPQSGEVDTGTATTKPAHRLRKEPNWTRNDDVLNGIAYNEKKGTIYVTGKHWPKLFEIKTF